jgi:hypothetical protein
MHILGVDIGGSGNKGAIVDTIKGLSSPNVTGLETQPATPEQLQPPWHNLSFI